MHDPVRYGWRRAGVLLGLGIAVLLALYWPTFVSMASIWRESDTFSHGFLVFPAVAFLVYRERFRLLALAPSPSGQGVAALAACLILWYGAHVGSVQVVTQFAVVAALCAMVLAVLGASVARALLFPMLFAFFAVPFGDVLIPTLMEFTAWFVVKAIELSGIPVLREGFMLSIPRGDFEVAKACSGIRYLIASFSLGTFYAYVTFAGWRKRVVFIVFALVLPIFANGLRAYGVVIIAHWTNMQHAVGLDHLVYGWLFFGLIMFLMFLVGGRFADEPIALTRPETEEASDQSPARLAILGTAVIAALVLPPGFASVALSAADTDLPAASLPVAVPPGWAPSPVSALDYRPAFENFDSFATASFRRDQARVTVTVHSYLSPDRELISQINVFPKQFGHKIMRELTEPLPGHPEAREVGRIDMLERGPRRSVLYWYQIDDRLTTSPLVAKFHEWWGRVLARPTRRALVTLSMPTDVVDAVPPALLDFAAANVDALSRCVAEPTAAECAPPGGLR
ncbi:MAG: exosortase A [Pseudomonadota bacterium]